MCVCVYIYVCVDIYICVCRYICICVYIYMCVHKYMHIHMYTHAHIYIHIYMYILLFHRNDLASGNHRHDRQVLDLHDLRHRLLVHGRALPDHRPKRGRRHGLHLRQDRVHVRTLHC
jgi:hypothetical protein